MENAVVAEGNVVLAEGTVDLEKLKEKLAFYENLYEKQKKKRNQHCYNYRSKHLDEVREYAKKKAKEYYDLKKNDPLFMEKKRVSALKSIHKKKQQQKEEETVLKN